MKRYILLLLLINISFNLFSQDTLKYNLENSLNGLYSTTKTGNQFNLSYEGTNSLNHGKFTFDIRPTYNIQYSPQISQNELIISENLRYTDGKNDLFITHTFNYSLMRGIDADNFIGAGYGSRYNISKNINTSFSYGILYHSTHFKNDSDREVIRHSFRVKSKISTKISDISFEYYYQPYVIDFSDYIIVGNTKFTFFPKYKINLIVQDFINYRSNDPKFKSIHNFTLGIGMKIFN